MAFPFRPIWPGVPLGFDRAGNPISYNVEDGGGGNAPCLCFGPPGSFKTVGLIVPQLLDEPGERSFIVIDPKGEIAAITANYRRKVCGKDNVKIINPFGVLVEGRDASGKPVPKRPDLKSDKWNPLNDLEPGALNFVDEASAKGAAIIKTAGHESQPFFPDAARSGFTAGIIAETKDADAQEGVTRSLPNVRAVFMQDPEKLRAVAEVMVNSGDYDIATRAAKFLDSNRETESIKSTMETATQWLTPAIREDMNTKEGVDFRACRKRPTTIYVIIPATELEAKGTYLRLILSSALRALYTDEGVPTTVIVEEAFVLGYHAEIEQALSILRGFGSRLTIIYQSLQQIYKRYPDTWGLFTAGAVCSFRPADTETGKWLVEKAGRITVPVFGAQEPRPGELLPSGGWQQRERERIPLAKMFGMPNGRAIVWKPGDAAPRFARVKGYFEIPKLNRRASPNPYYKGGKTRRGWKLNVQSRRASA